MDADAIFGILRKSKRSYLNVLQLQNIHSHQLYNTNIMRHMCHAALGMVSPPKNVNFWAMSKNINSFFCGRPSLKLFVQTSPKVEKVKSDF